jgi:hypothetical protein
VKQSDLAEYEENVKEKQRDTNIQGKSQAPLKPSHRDGKHQAPTQEGSNQTQGFSMARDHTPPETNAIKQAPRGTKANQTKRQTQSKTPTPLKWRT